MRFPLHASWGTSYGESRRLQFLLYVRDAAGLEPHGDMELPSLEPPVTGGGMRSLPAPQLLRLSQDWQSWWIENFDPNSNVETRRLPEPRRELPELADRPQLQHIAREVFDDAQDWIDRRLGERPHPTAEQLADGWKPIECDIIAEAIAARGWLRRFAAVGPFQLTISGLPLAGPYGRRISADHALVSRKLRQDPDAYRRWLLPMVADLLRTRPPDDAAGSAARR